MTADPHAFVRLQAAMDQLGSSAVAAAKSVAVPVFNEIVHVDRELALLLSNSAYMAVMTYLEKWPSE